MQGNRGVAPVGKILVVEDDSFFRVFFSDLLEKDGHSVDTASSGQEALQMLTQREYHVVITDLVLHDISGLDVLSRTKEFDPTIDVIVVTGHANMETAIFALKNGARDYLIKPINHDELKHSVALSLEQRFLLDENQELKQQIQLFQVSQAIANCQEQERLCKLILDSLAKEIGVSRGLGFFLGEKDELVLKEFKGFGEAVGQRLGTLAMARFDQNEGREGSFFLLNKFHLPAGEPELAGLADLKETMTLFIRSKTTLLGVVYLFNEPGRNLPGNINLRNIHFLLDQSSLALENAVRYARARNLVNIDDLTGLYNYRYLDLTLGRELKRAERYGAHVAVLFMDLDNFKNVNDTHGHLVGSRLLGEVGSLLKQSVREEDTVIRYGGDEYTVILVETDVPGAVIVAERIRRSIEGHAFLADDGLNIRLTASIGCACYPEDATTRAGLLELADQAMYRGKEQGKNVVYHIGKAA
jgi:two-component system cell cycle response regulator